MATKKKSIKELARAAASQGAPQRKKTRKKAAAKGAPSRKKKASSSDPLKKLSDAASVVKRAKRMIEDAEYGSRSSTRRR